MGIPTPRSYIQILSDIFDTFLSKFGVKRLKVGGPIISIMESAAQSDVRSTQDVFKALDSISLDRATGDLLTQIARSEDLFRIPLTAATGYVNFSDTSFTKVSSAIYQGASAPNIGTTSLKVSDASLFPNTGSVYIGRNTVNYEGPISYSGKTNVGPYWTITLSTGTTKFHNLGESVILAKGGNRQIPAGTAIQTPQGNVSDAISFTTLYSAQIDDGETLLEGVEVIAQQGGVIGNVPARAISQIISSPYVGAAVINPLPFTNGKAEELDDSLRERVRKARQAKAKGTRLAVSSNVIGVSSTFDNKTVLSSSIVAPQGQAATLFIDDGTGYEEATEGVPQETLMDSALGGEKYFQLSSQRPVAKAFLTTTISAPYILTNGMKLAVEVGGVLSEHTFNASNFKSISNASGYEIVSSINGDPNLLFSARTLNSGTLVSIFAKSETDEDLLVTDPSDGTDANTVLGFPTGLNYTLRLYKNDQFLYKDGKSAIITSNFQNEWATTITGGDTLLIQVDGTATQTITVNNADFISNNTGYSTVNKNNSLEAWATVFTAKIAGVTVEGENGALTFTSNAGKTARAQLTIVGGTLVTKGMFEANDTASGASNDYTLNRNLGQLTLTTALEEGDNLVAATDYTRAYLQSPAFSGNIVLSATANLWLLVDGEAELLSTGVNSSTSIALTSIATNRARYTAANNTFGDTDPYIIPGDWVVLWDPAFTEKGMWRISAIDTTNFAWFEVERATVTAETAAPSNSGIAFVRSTEQIQNVSIPAGTYSLSALITAINADLVGAEASLYRNEKIRITTNSYGDGDIMLVTADVAGQQLQLESGILVENNPSHFAVIESGNSEVGTPGFKWTTVATTPSSTTFTSTVTPTNLPLRSGDIIAYRKRLNIAANNRFGANAYDHQVISGIVSGVVTPRVNSKTAERLVTDRFYAAHPFGLSYNDNLQVVLDKDTVSKNYDISLFRNIIPQGSATYGATPFEVRDADNGNTSLFNAFGASTTFFNDFALYMKARGKSHSITSNKAILWRFPRYGSDGNYATVAFANPSEPSATFDISTNVDDGNANINIKLPSGTERTGLNINGNNSFVVTSNTTYSATAANVVRATNVVTVTLAASGVTNTHTLAIGDLIYQNTDQTTGNVFRKGPKAVTGVTANTFTYAETGSDGAANMTHTFTVAKRPAGTKNTVSGLVSSGTAITATIGAHVFQAGDTVYFAPGHFDAASAVEITAGAKVLTSVAATTVTWAESTTAASANLIAGVTYNISSGRCQKINLVYYKAEVAVGGLVRVGNTVTATINTTPIISTHPFVVGDVVYLSSAGEADFPAGPKIITSVGATSFTYIEAGAATSSAAIQYFAHTNTDINLTGGGTPVSAGHIAHIDAETSLDTNVESDVRVFSVSSTGFSFLKDDASYTGNTTPKKLNATANLRFYPINAAGATAALIRTWVNTNASDIVTATLVPSNGSGATTGAAQVDTATREEFYLSTNNASIGGANSQSVYAWSLFDGLNWVQSTNLVDASSSTIGLKDTVSGELTANADFTNENMRLVPITVNNLINYLGSSGVSGFANNSIVTSSFDGKKLQLGSSTLGSEGTVQITGGTANQASATLIGTGSAIAIGGTDTYSKITVTEAQSKGFMGGAWVSVEAEETAPKLTPWVSGSTMTIVATAEADEWKIQFSGGVNAVSVIQVINASQKYQIEKQGNFMAYIDCSNSPTALSVNIKEGDWAYIVSSVANAANTGYKQVVRVDTTTNTFWVEGTGVEEVITFDAADYVKFITYDSVIPGDTFIINTNIFGADNIGEFVVSDISESGASTTATEFFVEGELTAVSATTLGSNYIFVQAKEENPLRLIKKIRTININDLDNDNVDVVFTTSAYASKMSEARGAIMRPLDKLDFGTSIYTGLDGYSFNTGLLAEVNKVAYGDEGNPSVYPGVIALGANVNISGPLVKRIALSLEIRLRTGVSSTEVIDRIKSAVASYINSIPIGTSIALSGVVSAANAIDGVISVVILSPTYSSSNDLITVQASEKPLILDINQDILVSIVN